MHYIIVQCCEGKFFCQTTLRYVYKKNEIFRMQKINSDKKCFCNLEILRTGIYILSIYKFNIDTIYILRH